MLESSGPPDPRKRRFAGCSIKLNQRRVHLLGACSFAAPSPATTLTMHSIAVLACLVVVALTSSSALVVHSSSAVQPRRGMVLMMAKEPSGWAEKIWRAPKAADKPKASSGPVYDPFYDGVDEEKDKLSIAAAAVFFVGLVALVQSLDYA